MNWTELDILPHATYMCKLLMCTNKNLKAKWAPYSLAGRAHGGA